MSSPDDRTWQDTVQDSFRAEWNKQMRSDTKNRPKDQLKIPSTRAKALLTRAKAVNRLVNPFH